MRVKGMVLAKPVIGLMMLVCALVTTRMTLLVVMGDTAALSADKKVEQVVVNSCDARDGQCSRTPKVKDKEEVIITFGNHDEHNSDPTNDCTDDHALCGFWAQSGECENNPTYMLDHCRLSCHVCSIDADWNTRELNQELDDQDEDSDLNEDSDLYEDPDFDEDTIFNFDETEFGEKQDISGAEADLTRRVVMEMIAYMQNQVYANPHEYPSNVREGCRNRNTLCAFWAAIGECEKNPGYMKLQCAPSCKTCDRLDFSKRCPYNMEGDPDFPNAMEPGDLHRMFEKIVAPDSEFQKYKPIIHSRPYTPGAEGVEGQPLEKGQIEGPWVLTFDEFLTEQESDILIELGSIEGYERSTDVGEQLFDGTFDKKESFGRTSHNAWCKEQCMKNETAQVVLNRIESVTGVPTTNYESFQLLRYELDQKYNTHHDFIDHQSERQCGPRILTFFLYLSDVEEGGGTNFPRLRTPDGSSITVMPKKGQALLWPSVLDEDLHERDDRTFHQALPVIRGTKYAANSWIHLRDFETANNAGCS